MFKSATLDATRTHATHTRTKAPQQPDEFQKHRPIMADNVVPALEELAVQEPKKACPHQQSNSPHFPFHNTTNYHRTAPTKRPTLSTPDKTAHTSAHSSPTVITSEAGSSNH